MQLVLDMFAVMAAECTSLLRHDVVTAAGSSTASVAEADTVMPPCRSSDDLCALLPCIKVFSDWMTCHESLWNPPPLPRDPELGYLLRRYLLFCVTFWLASKYGLNTVQNSKSMVKDAIWTCFNHEVHF